MNSVTVTIESESRDMGYDIHICIYITCTIYLIC